MTIMKRLTSTLLILCFSMSGLAQTRQKFPAVSVKELILPSEVQNLPKRSGSVYYNQSVKGKVLVPVNYWGQVTLSGLHFVPAETNLIQGLSMAGGPNGTSKLSNVKLIRKNGKKITIKEFNLTEGGNADAYAYKLQPHDTIFVERSSYFEDRAYYTTLVSVFVSLLSGIIIFNQTQK